MANQVDYRDPTPNNFPNDYDPAKVDPRVKLRSESIKNKQKGKHTREAMYQALEIGAVTAGEAKTTADKTAESQDNLNQRVNDQIIAGTIKDEEIDFRHSDMLKKTFNTMRLRGDFYDQELARRGVNVDWFGTVGDGKTDDTAALITAHDFANANGYDVIYGKNKTYYLSNNQEITVKTNVDFNDSTILIDDTTGSSVHAYHAVNDTNTIMLDAQAVGAINAGQTNSALSGYGNALTYIEDNSDVVYKRSGANANDGQAKGEAFIINNDGAILSPMMFDYKRVTRCEIRPFNPAQVTFKNGHFVSKGFITGTDLNKSYARDFYVERNQSKLINCSHNLEDDQTGKLASQGFFFHRRVAEQAMQDITVQPRIPSVVSDNVTRGTYEIGNYDVVNIQYSNVNGFSLSDNVWGCFGGFRMKNAIFDNVKLNRIDSHLPSQNIYIRHSEIGDKGIRLTGFGDLEISNTTVHSGTVLSLREDYGATWNGDIQIKNVILDTRAYLNQAAKFNVINCGTALDHDYGYQLTVGNHLIDIQNVTVLEQADREDKFVILNFDLSNVSGAALQNYYLADNINIKNVRRQHGRAVKLFGSKTLNYVCGHHQGQFKYLDTAFSGKFNLVTNVNITIANTRLWKKYDTAVTSISSSSLFDDTFPGAIGDDDTIINNEYGMIPNFVIKNCLEVNATTEGYACALEVDNTSIAGLYCLGNGTRTMGHINNCSIVPRPRDLTKSNIIRCGDFSFFFNNCTFKSGYLYDAVSDVDQPITAQQNVIVYDNLFSGIDTFPTTYLKFHGAYSNCQFSATFDTATLFNAIHFSKLFGGYANYIACLVKGTTAQQPKKANIGALYFDTDAGKLMYYNGASWQ